MEYTEDYYYIEKSLELTNQTTEGAEYMRDYRARKKQEAYICKEDCKTDIDKEKEEELEKRNKNKEIDIEEDKEDKFPYNKIIFYLNELAGTNYREDAQWIIDLMKEHVKNGYTPDDFISVINKKWREWKGTDMIKYMRPNTLFGYKFEEYLNQKENPLNEWLNEKEEKKFYANEQ